MSDSPPILILSAPGSAATQLQSGLAVHPDLLPLPPLPLFMADRCGDLLQILNLDQSGRVDDLVRAVHQLHQLSGGREDADHSWQWLQRRADKSSADLLQDMMALAAPRRLLIADSESPMRPMDMRRIMTSKLAMKRLHLTHHPMAQGLDLACWAREQLFVPVDYKDHAGSPPLVDPQIPWIRANRNIAAALGPDAAPESRRVSLEAVVAQDGTAADQLFSWLGLTVPAGWADAAAALRAAIKPLPESSLDQALPWRTDGKGFDSAVIELARTYGY